MTCALIGTSRKLATNNLPSALMTLEYELVDANGVCLGIQKVRVEPATRNVAAT